MSSENKFLTEGVRSMFMSTLAFSLANVFVKQISHIPAMEVVFFRCFLGVVFCSIGLTRARASFLGLNIKLLVLRGLFGTSALYLFFSTLQNSSLATAQTIQYLSPIFTSIIAIFVLHETVKIPQWIFYAVAFAGVVLIGQFDVRISPTYLIMGVVSAFCSGMAYNLVRSLRGREHPLTVVFHFQFFGMIAGFIATLFNWTMPQGWDWLFLILIGVCSQVGQIFLTNALQQERAASVSIVNYSGLIYALLIGWLVFGETLQGLAIVGILLVVAGVIASVIYAKRRGVVEAKEAAAG